VAEDLITGRQTALSRDQKEDILTSAVFRIWTVQGSANFAELGGITSEVEQTEYQETGPFGAMFSRHAGRAKPPTVVLKRAMRTGFSTTWLWTWHQFARQSLPLMYRDCALTFFGPGDDIDGVGRMTYLMMNAFPTKLEIGGVKAGGTDYIVQSVTLQCDDMIDPNAV
jgi:hypothetical protein